MEDFSKPSDTNLIKVPISGLLPGMFIAALDRPWLETPFTIQGFVIRDERDAEYVGKHCEFVYVDPQKRAVGTYPLKAQSKTTIEPDKIPLKTEFEHSKVDFASASEVMASVFAQVKSHRPVDLAVLQSAINPLIDSVFRNREALAALIRMKRKDDYFYNHSLSTAIWAVILGRHLGLEKSVLRQLALGASIMDVGMAELPDELLNTKEQLDAPQIAQVRGHVAASLRLVQEDGEVPNTVMNIIACHHERYDGSGYPQGLSGNDIPRLARIAGLADTYDAMITDRPYSAARSSFDAIQELADSKDVLFQGSMVEHFVQAVGMFPTGAVVELNTGEVGVVVEQNTTRRLRPKVVLILDETKNKRSTLTVLDLSKYAVATSASSTMWIAKELEIGAFGIAPDDYFL